MGKRIISQRRGRGTLTYRAPSHRFKAELKHVEVRGGETLSGVVAEIMHDPARSAPIAKVCLTNGEEHIILIPEGMAVGETVSFGTGAGMKTGNSIPLAQIPDGAAICNVELRPGDGGRFARSSGTHATIIAHEGNRVVVQLPSGVNKWLDQKCLATIGTVAGGGRSEKPLVKAGKMYHKAKARAMKWPRVRGIAMNSVDHPFGGGRHQHVGRPKTSSRGAPPGRKVGSIAARRTGRK